MKLATATLPWTSQCQSSTVITVLTAGEGGVGVPEAMSALVAMSPPSLKNTTRSSSNAPIAAPSLRWPASENSCVFWRSSAETSASVSAAVAAETKPSAVMATTRPLNAFDDNRMTNSSLVRAILHADAARRQAAPAVAAGEPPRAIAAGERIGHPRRHEQGEDSPDDRTPPHRHRPALSGRAGRDGRRQRDRRRDRGRAHHPRHPRWRPACHRHAGRRAERAGDRPRRQALLLQQWRVQLYRPCRLS